MKKVKTIGLGLFLAVFIASLTACGGGGNKISDGAKDMKDVLASFKSSVESGDATKAKEEANELEESWEKFEDGVKDKSAELYEKTETPLHAIQAGAESDPLDKAALQKSIEELDQVLTDIEGLK